MIPTTDTPPLQVLHAAIDRVYAAWLPHIGEAEAREQADRFARHFYHNEKVMPA